MGAQKPFKWDEPRNARIQDNVNEDLTSAQEQNEGGVQEVHGLPEGVSSADIWNAVESIRRSPGMSGCNRLTQLLDFVVASTLRGEAAHLKETTIGVYVFGRSPDYDPKVDTIVRSQAWRLRAKLRKYYESEGANAPIVIEIPIGHYIPVFHVRAALETC
jgi:hypothetical protein